ncbi:MAG: hypothetical protein ACYCOU_24570 [Sulfobacillus sp.]
MGETNTMTPDLNAQCIQDVLDIKSAAVASSHGLSGDSCTRPLNTEWRKIRGR